MSYYYLISGLPDLSLEKAIENRGKVKYDIDELIDTIDRNLEPEDRQPFHYLLYPQDIHNFLSALQKKHYDIPRSTFFKPSVVDKETINNYSKHRSDFPIFMSDFIGAYEDQFSSMSPAEMGDKLWHMYYDEALSSDPYVSEYCRFERNIQQLFAVYNQSIFKFLNTPAVYDNPLVALAGAGRALPKEVIRDFPFVEGLAEVLSNKNPLEINTYFDRVIWDYLDQGLGFFGREQVYAFTIKLISVAKWQRKDEEVGYQRFIDLQEDIKNNVRSFKTAVI